MNYKNITRLSPAEENRLVMEAQAGSERAMERLLDAYETVIDKAARSVKMEYDDARQEAVIAFIKHVTEHDFEKPLSKFINVKLAADVSDAASDDNTWGIPGRTLRRYLHVYNKAEQALNAYAVGEQIENDKVRAVVEANPNRDAFYIGSLIAPIYDLAAANYLDVAAKFNSGSISITTGSDSGGEDDVADASDYNDARLVGSMDMTFEEAQVGEFFARPLSDEHLHIIRLAYGFEGSLDLGDRIAQPMKAREAHADGVVAAAMNWEGYGERKWTRQTVNRRRNDQIAAWQDYAGVNTSTGKDN